MKTKFRNFTPAQVFYIVSLSLLLLTVLILSKKAKVIFFMLGFIALNLFVTSYKRLFRPPIEIETLSFGIVLCSYSYGITAGLVVAILGGVLYFTMSSNFNPFTIPMLGGYVLMAAIGSVFSDYNIVIVGIGANLAHNLFIFLTYHFLFRYNPTNNILFSLSNLLFNAFLFSNFSPLVFNLMR